jgi:(1->4)-alpha-D-glucan 1-alpha-D-glucosylmutase
VQADRLVAFMRHDDTAAAIVIAPRLTVPLLADAGGLLPPAECWGDTAIGLPPGYESAGFHNEMVGAEVRTGENRLLAADILSAFPVALLTTDRKNLD